MVTIDEDSRNCMSIKALLIKNYSWGSLNVPWYQ